MSFPFIDLHSHFVPLFYRDALKEAGYLSGPDACPDWSVENHLAFMQSSNVRRSYLSLSAPGTFLKKPSDGDSLATDAAKSLTRRVNEFGLSIRRDNPNKFGYFASLPLPDVEASLEELAFLETQGSIDGFTLLSNSFGVYIGDETYTPIYEKLNILKAIVLVHPNTASYSPPFNASQRPATQPDLFINHPRETTAQPERQTLGLDFAFDSTLAFANIILTNTATRYPNIKWIIPHCAFVLPTILSRLLLYSSQQTQQSLDSYEQLTKDKIKSLLRSNFYFDLAGIPMTHQINTVLEWVDLTRFVFGSDVPYTEWRLAGELCNQVREELLRMFGMETGVHECMRICHGNAERLFAEKT